MASAGNTQAVSKPRERPKASPSTISAMSRIQAEVLKLAELLHGLEAYTIDFLEMTRSQKADMKDDDKTDELWRALLKCAAGHTKQHTLVLGRVVRLGDCGGDDRGIHSPSSPTPSSSHHHVLLVV